MALLAAFVTLRGNGARVWRPTKTRLLSLCYTREIQSYSGRPLAMMENSQEHDAPAVVLVTGASGFVATHIVKQLLEGGYRVRGTVRSLNNEEKVAPLHKLCPDAKYPLELVEADLLKQDTWDSAVEGCRFVMHTASPFPDQDSKDPENDVVKPAMEGTTNVLEACARAKVKRVVLTSSVAAIIGGLTDPARPDYVFSEEDWPRHPDSLASGYMRSKVLAERAAWELQKSLPEESRFELAVINPVYSMGPLLNNTVCSSMTIPKRLLCREMPAIPRLWMDLVDVRDVALAHIRAMTTPEAAGHRHLIAGQAFWLRDLALGLEKEFKPQGYPFITLHCPTWAAWLYRFLDPVTKFIYPYVGCKSHLNTDRMKNVLKIKSRSTEDAVRTMCYSLIERGWVKKTDKYWGLPQNRTPNRYS